MLKIVKSRFLPDIFCFFFCFTLLLVNNSFAKENPSPSPSPETLVTPIFFPPEAQKWVIPPNNFPVGVELMLLEGDPKQAMPFTMRLKLPANHEVQPHWHPADERVTVISGHIMMGLGDTLDKNKEANSLPAGSYFKIPAKTNHYGWTTEETILQLTGHGPWCVNFLKTNSKPEPNKRK